MDNSCFLGSILLENQARKALRSAEMRIRLHLRAPTTITPGNHRETYLIEEQPHGGDQDLSPHLVCTSINDFIATVSSIIVQILITWRIDQQHPITCEA